jgi:hypothetical protein
MVRVLSGAPPAVRSGGAAVTWEAASNKAVRAATKVDGMVFVAVFMNGRILIANATGVNLFEILLFAGGP